MYYGFGRSALGMKRTVGELTMANGLLVAVGMRDFRKLRTFQLSDRLVDRIYLQTRSFPTEERYGLQAQLRRAAVSVPTNIAEGSARRTQGEYLQFLHVAMGSAVEVAYLVRLSIRLAMLAEADAGALADSYDEVVRRLQRQIDSLIDC